MHSLKTRLLGLWALSLLASVAFGIPLIQLYRSSAQAPVGRLPPPEAARLAPELAPGGPLYVQGDGVAGPLGRVIEARSIGPSSSKLAEVAVPAPPGLGWRSAPPPPPGGLAMALPPDFDAPPPPARI